MAKQNKNELLATYKQLSGQDAPAKWTIKQLQAEINTLLAAADEEEEEEETKAAEESKDSKGKGKSYKGLVPGKDRLAIPASDQCAGGVIESKDWTDEHTDEYLKAFADRKEKALEKLITVEQRKKLDAAREAAAKQKK